MLNRRYWLILASVLSFGRFAAADRWVHPTHLGDRSGDRSGDRLGDRPVWGVDGGLEIGIPPTPGPRGLIRIYTPYLHMSADRMINFIAVEPTVHGQRDLSEIQQSAIDHAPGKRIDAVDHLEDQPDHLANGVVERVHGVEQMSLYLKFEPFDNGAHVAIRVIFRADAPDEVTFQTIAAPDSAPMESCVLTATMGNYAILRHLHLKDRVVEAADIFAGQQLGFWDFYPWHEWPASALIHDHGQLRIDVTGDGNGSTATTTPTRQPLVVVAPIGWRYEGDLAVQSWSTADRPGVVARVNGRQTYWGTQSAIPGGVAFENVELAAPFEDRQIFAFRVTPRY